ncbi:hypothetical protein MIR68_012547, partial [Amoeboaphelidium protococcarum]
MAEQGAAMISLSQEDLARVVQAALRGAMEAGMLSSSSTANQKETSLISLKLPEYDGTGNLNSWLDMVENSLRAAPGNVSSETAIRHAARYLRGGAWEWFRKRTKDGNFPFADWGEFADELKRKFLVGSYDDVIRRQMKGLKQRGSVLRYVKEFRALEGQIDNMTEADRIFYFKDGLKHATRGEVEYRRPLTLEDAIDIAQSYDDAHYGRSGRMEPATNGANGTNAWNSRNRTNGHSGQQQYPGYQRRQAGRNPDDMELDNIKHKETRKCYGCGDTGHLIATCPKKKSSNMMVANQADHNSHSHTLVRVFGEVNNHQLNMLVDSGASHNFMSLVVAKKIGLAIELHQTGGDVVLGDGQHVKCHGIARNVQLQLAEVKDRIDIIILSSCSEDLILGMPWLSKHNPQINWNTQQIAIDGVKLRPCDKVESLAKIELATANEVNRLLKDPCNSSYVLFMKTLEVDEEEQPDFTQVKSDLDTKNHQKLVGMLEEFQDVFKQKLSGLPSSRDIEHKIKLIDDQPVYRPPYRLSPREQEALEKQLAEMLDQGLIRPSSSPFASPVLFVKKKDGTLRMVIDYRMLNRKTVKDRYPLPRIDQLLDNTVGARVFSKLDLVIGFYQILMKSEDVHKTAFSTPLGSYELLVMPMGQANATATFQRLMDAVFPYAEFNKFLQKLIDDMLVHTCTEEEHLEALRVVLLKLREHKLFVKFSKCEFGRKSMIWLGHKLENGCRAIDPQKARDIRDFQLPHTYKQLMSFIGLVNFVREYLPGLSKVSSIVTDLTKDKPKVIEWTTEAINAFNKIKDMIADSIELTIPDPSKEFIMETDASDKALGAVLKQENQSGQLVIVAVASRKLGYRQCLPVKCRQQIVATTIKEMSLQSSLKQMIVATSLSQVSQDSLT